VRDSDPSQGLQVFDDEEEEGKPLLRIPNTGLILLTAERGSPPIITADLEETAAPLDVGAHHDLFPKHHIDLSDQTLLRRPLSTEELAELRKVAHTRIVRPRPWMFLYMAYLLLGISAGIFQPRTDGSVIRSIAYSAFFVLTAYGLVTAFAGMRRFRKDIAERCVVRIEGDEGSVEVLPHTGYVWSVNGEPSMDRKVGVSARKI
jgi:hypothetical protein